MFASLALLIGMSAGITYTGSGFQGGSTISGKIKYNGSPPPPARLSITMDRQYCGASRVDDSLQVSTDGSVRNVVVFLSDIRTGKYMAAPRRLVINQIGCHYIPRISAVAQDAVLEVKSSDPVLHNIHTYREGTTLMNFAIPPRQNFTLSRKLDKPGGIKLKCDVHPFMRGAIFVAANPYYAITGEDGSYELSNVPPGTYTINTWHELAGTISQQVTVPENGAVAWNAKIR
jgi:hypothetical protein